MLTANPCRIGLTVPEEIKRRKTRKEALEIAKKVIENRYQVTLEEKQKEYEEKKTNVISKEKTGKNQEVVNLNHQVKLLLTKCNLISQTKKAE